MKAPIAIITIAAVVIALAAGPAAVFKIGGAEPSRRDSPILICARVCACPLLPAFLR